MNTLSLPVVGTKQDIERVSILLKIIAHPIRLQILCLLSLGDQPVRDIVQYVGTSQSNVSQHLSRLKEKNILSVNKKANSVYYSIGDERVLSLLGQMREIFCQGEEEQPPV